MKAIIRSFAALAAASLTAVSMAQAPTFKHLKSIDLSTQFDNVNTLGLGNYCVDVAFDGVNAYVVGSNQTTTGTSNQGVLRIANVLGTHAVDALPLLIVAGQGNNGDSKIEYAGGSLYVGTGFLASNEAIGGIRKYDTAGNLDVAFSGGVITASELSASTRIDSMTIDPGFNGSGATLGVLSRARGFLFRRDLNTGADAGNAQFGTVVNSNTWRDASFDANGNGWFRAQNDVLAATRTADSGNPSFNAMTNLVDLGSQENPIQNVHFQAGVSPFFSNVLFYNNRASGNNKVIVISPTNAWAQIDLLGNEDGIGTAFANTQQNFKTYTVGGRVYLFVTAAGTIDRLDVYEVNTSVSLVPSSYSLTVGGEFTGDLASLAASDDNRLCFFNDEFSLTASVVFNANTSLSALTEISCSAETLVERLGIAVTMSFFRATTNQFVVVGGTTATSTDSVLTASVTTNADSFRDSNGDISMKLDFAPINDEDPSQDGWLHCVDQVVWTLR